MMRIFLRFGITEVMFFDSLSLKKWFLSEKRDLPWRLNPTPYEVWVSEVMLQQTQVSVVIPYFERWMKKFPSIESLACASIDEAIKLWEGLGYYSRVRNLHAGAKYLWENHQGVFPEDHRVWKNIKGLGPYTIGAIRSFAFHQKAPAVDGNVIRVLTRYFNIQDDIAKSAAVGYLWKLAEEILPEDAHWVHNEALIELGATVCTRIPQCRVCPLRTSCKGHAGGVASQLPVNSRKVSSTILHRAVSLMIAREMVMVRQCGPKEIMAGLHEFPYVEIHPEENPEFAASRHIKEAFQVQVLKKKKLEQVSHSFTRYHARLHPFLFEIDGGVSHSDYQWVSIKELDKLAFSSGHRKILMQLKLPLKEKELDE